MIDDDIPVDPLDWSEFTIWSLNQDIKECCYYIQQIKCLLRNSDLND